MSSVFGHDGDSEWDESDGWRTRDGSDLDRISLYQVNRLSDLHGLAVDSHFTRGLEGGGLGRRRDRSHGWPRGDSDVCGVVPQQLHREETSCGQDDRSSNCQYGEEHRN